ncbi:MAG: 5'/3'-nucleotidase SurE [Chitinivibrionales bacterium]|nr:5'/3'-nucleotidase SurE [Chitinivibrionales bacterium]
MSATRDWPVNVLLTNDDGVDAYGLNALAKAIADSHAVTVAAPAAEQSGIGHAFTFNTPLTYAESRREGLVTFAIRGTPADCVKFAVSHLLGQRPDVIVSGINVGENSGTSSIYSGTVAAAREGALWGIPSVAFSVTGSELSWVDGYAAQSALLLEWLTSVDAGRFVRHHARTFFNVNFPPCAPAQCRGLVLTRQSLAFFDDHYRAVDEPAAGQGYVLYGEKQDLESSLDYDSRALLDDYATLTPMGLDATDHTALSHLRDLGPAPDVQVNGRAAAAPPDTSSGATGTDSN